MALAGGGVGTFRHLEGKLLTLDPACKTLNFPPLLSLQLFSSIVGTDLSAVITWAGLGLSAAEPHAL